MKTDWGYIREAQVKAMKKCNEVLNEQRYLTKVQANAILSHYLSETKAQKLVDIYDEVSKEFECYKESIGGTNATR